MVTIEVNGVLAIVAIASALLVLYVVVRLAVRHALRDAAAGPAPVSGARRTVELHREATFRE